MVCFYEEFDERPLDVWKRIESGEHFKEENCLELIEILRKQTKSKRKSNDESSTLKRVKLDEISLKSEEKSSQEVKAIKSTEEEVQKYLNAKEHLGDLSSKELRKIKVSNKLAHELAEKDVKPTPDEVSSLIKICEENTPQEKNVQLAENDISTSELNFLIDNFDCLQSEDQNNLISFLQKLEKNDPEKFKSLH